MDTIELNSHVQGALVVLGRSASPKRICQAVLLCASFTQGLNCVAQASFGYILHCHYENRVPMEPGSAFLIDSVPLECIDFAMSLTSVFGRALVKTVADTPFEGEE